MRAVWAISAGLLLGAGIAWWLSRESAERTQAKQQRAQRAAAELAEDARPSLYRWRDAGGVLQITDQPPQGREYERVDRQSPPGIEIRGEAAN